DQAEEIAEDIENGETNRPKRQAFKDWRYPNTIWDQGLYYYFGSSANDKVRRAFLLGAEMWRKDTCINFTHSWTAPNRVRVIAGNGCWSYVGKIRRSPQDLSLGSGCEVSGARLVQTIYLQPGIAAHEIGHALGFFHTHSRHDRDQFITVYSGNIRHDWLDQFNRESTNTNDNYGITYDYGSLMHYGAHRLEIRRAKP
ncbi:astacin, partial [Oesophagostomum dentatum]